VAAGGILAAGAGAGHAAGLEVRSPVTMQFHNPIGFRQ
jgi:hypothetical protein